MVFLDYKTFQGFSSGGEDTIWNVTYKCIIWAEPWSVDNGVPDFDRTGDRVFVETSSNIPLEVPILYFEGDTGFVKSGSYVASPGDVVKLIAQFNNTRARIHVLRLPEENP